MKEDKQQTKISQLLENNNKNLNFAIMIIGIIFIFVFTMSGAGYVNSLNSRIKFLEENNKMLTNKNLALQDKLLDFILTANVHYIDINQTSTTGNNTNNLYKNQDEEEPVINE